MDSLMPARGVFAKGTPFPAAKKENILAESKLRMIRIGEIL